MHTITMPKAGQSMEEGTIVRWLKAEGDNVAEGELLLEIETDKATVEVEAASSGILRRILIREGQAVPVLAPIAILGGADEDVNAGIRQAEQELSKLLGDAAPAAAHAPEPPSPAAEKPAGGPVTPILMPQAGQSMEEGTIVKWRVKPGDRIAKGDIIFDVETDKAVVEVEATESGRLARIVVEEGVLTPVLTPVAYLADSDADVDAHLAGGNGASVAAPSPSKPAEAKATPATPVQSAAPTTPAAKTASGRLKASPAARKAAARRGVDLATVGAGSGPGGRILSTDVERAPIAASGAAPAGAPTRRKLTGMRKAIARNLLVSKQTIPHFYMRLTIDAAPLFAFYRAEKAKYPCSVNDVITLACARAIMEFPAFRGRLDGEEIVEFPGANIGIAVGMDDGLVVPVLVGADRLTLREAAAETRRIAEAARKGRIEGLGQGVFTITNLGMFGVEEFSAIINPPEAAILAVGALREDIIVSDGALRPGRVMTMTLSADHRLIDGLLAAKFLARLKEILEAPEKLLGA